MPFQSLPLVSEYTAKTIQHLVDLYAEETDPLQEALVRHRDLLKQKPPAQALEAALYQKQLKTNLQRIRVKFHKLRRAYAEIAQRSTEADRQGVPEKFSRRFPEVMLAYLVSGAFGLKFQVKAADLRWTPGNPQASWWMQAQVTDSEGKVYECEETGPVFPVDLLHPPQVEDVSQGATLYPLWMDLFLHGMRLAVPSLPWDDWVE